MRIQAGQALIIPVEVRVPAAAREVHPAASLRQARAARQVRETAHAAVSSGLPVRDVTVRLPAAPEAPAREAEAVRLEEGGLRHSLSIS